MKKVIFIIIGFCVFVSLFTLMIIAIRYQTNEDVVTVFYAKYDTPINEVIKANNIGYKQITRSKLNNNIYHSKDIIGKRTISNIKAGEYFTTQNIKED